MTWLTVRPSTLRMDDGCPAMLDASLRDERGVADAFTRSRLRDPLLKRLRGARPPLRRRHLEGAADGLLPEEQSVFDAMVEGYLELFEGETAQPLQFEAGFKPTELRRREVVLGGWVDLLLEDGTALELRQLELWGRPLCADPFANPTLALAVLRLRALGMVGPARCLRVRHVDPLARTQDLVAFDVAADLGRLAAQLDDGLDRLRAAADPAVRRPGRGCSLCQQVGTCAAVTPDPPPGAAPVPDGSLVGQVLTLSPSAVERWRRCPRAFRARHLLHLPGSDRFDDDGVGVRVHRLLEDLHAAGPCTSADAVHAFLAARLRLGDPTDAHVASLVERHVPLCPQRATSVGHEHALARVEASGWPLVVVTGRLDACWAVGGVLEVRDYKTGLGPSVPLAHDPAAQVQAWLAAPLARSMGLELRLRYELLSPDADDELAPWSPAEEDLDGIGAGLRGLATELGDGWEVGSSEAPAVCDRCEHRTVCPVRAVG
jgi:RecB family exonuclease